MSVIIKAGHKWPVASQSVDLQRLLGLPASCTSSLLNLGGIAGKMPIKTTEATTGLLKMVYKFCM
jgi:hypothetical protein